MATLNPKPREFPKLITMDDITEEPMQWLWYPYIPIGMATMMYGRGGIGKSHITCDIASRISTGAAWPGEDTPRIPQKVLMLAAEDDYARVLKPRLRRLGANMGNIYLPESENFVLDAIGIRGLEEYMRQMAATIVFIDPVAFYLGGKVDMNRMNEVREFTGALHQAAKNANCAIVIVHHSKKGDGQDYEKAAGSVDFVNAMRSTLFVDVTPDGDKVMRNPKNNNASPGRTLAFTFNEDTFEWLHDYDDGGEVGNGPDGGTQKVKAQGAKSKAVAFIKHTLRDGPIAAVDLLAMAADEGFNQRTLQRAKAGVAESYPTRVNGTMTWFWRLLGGDKHEIEIQKSKASALGFAKEKNDEDTKNITSEQDKQLHQDNLDRQTGQGVRGAAGDGRIELDQGGSGRNKSGDKQGFREAVSLGENDVDNATVSNVEEWLRPEIETPRDGGDNDSPVDTDEASGSGVRDEEIRSGGLGGGHTGLGGQTASSSVSPTVASDFQDEINRILAQAGKVA